MTRRVFHALAMWLAIPTTIAAASTTSAISLDGEGWRLATDPQNVGVNEKWWEAPRPDAKPTKVPWTIQAVFPGYAGYAWYWRDVDVPANPHTGGRYLLRFWEVDYIADVYVNGTHVGRHEGAAMRFDLDATAAIKPGAINHIAVRVLSLWGTMEGIVRSQTPHGGCRDINMGGIMDSVELLIVPQIRINDLFVRGDVKTGAVRVETEVFNDSKNPVKGIFNFVVSPAAGGDAVASTDLEQEIPPGASTVRAELRIANHRLWQLNDPYLYRAAVRLTATGSNSFDEYSTKFGFRDFRFENGYFRLNGQRIFWRSAHTGADTPITIRVPFDPGMVRQDLINLKAMGFNGIRFISMLGHRHQLDMCDEIGLMVYEESYASWMLDDSPKLPERMDATLSAMVGRDRNHPSIVMWGLLNETGNGGVFQHAVASLPLMRKLDDSRVVLLGSGRFDATHFLNGLEVWKPEGADMPSLSHNPKEYAISCVTLFRPKEIALRPGANGEYGDARWTAPADGEYTISARFRATGTYTTTSIHVLAGGKPVYDSFINLQGRGDDYTWNGTLALSKDQTLDFLVGGRSSPGGDWYMPWGNNTSLAVSIKSSDGKTSDLAGEFSNAKNPNGPWTYGMLAAGPKPDAATFKAFARCDTFKHDDVGDLCNPGSDHWEDVLGDQHYYPRVPHRELEIARLRQISINDNHMMLSEYGVGSGVDMPRFIRHHEQRGVESAERLNAIKSQFATFLGDWDRLKLADTFANPEDFFRQCLARQAGLKTLGINALRSNPNMVGYGMTGANDPLEFGEGQWTAFRELKPGTTDAIFEAFYPVHWCTFAEPPCSYRGSKVRLEAVLANEDCAPPGAYPARLQVVDPNNKSIVDRTITVTIPGKDNGKEPPFAIPVFSEDVPIDGPTGKYRFLITFQKGVAATGGEATFYIADPADMPSIEIDVTLWSEDPELTGWLKQHGVKTKAYQPGQASSREVILVSHTPNAGGSPEAWRDLATRIAQGSTAVFLVPDVFQKNGNALGWLPLARKGGLFMVCEYTFPQVYPKDEWVKRHPLFDGLPSGGLMDYGFYREMIPDQRYGGQDTPDEAVAGSFRTSMPGAYWCDTMVSIHKFGEGRFILNALRVRQTLGQDPTAERLLRNMLRYAASNVAKPPAALPANFEEQMKAIGY